MSLSKTLSLLTVEQFRAWLATLPPGQIVGKENCQGGCPLANYLKHHGIEAQIGNFFDMSTIEVNGEKGELPCWAQNFARVVDEGEYSVAVRVPDDEIATLKAEGIDTDTYFDYYNDDGQPIRYEPEAKECLEGLDYMIENPDDSEYEDVSEYKLAAVK